MVHSEIKKLVEYGFGKEIISNQERGGVQWQAYLILSLIIFLIHYQVIVIIELMQHCSNLYMNNMIMRFLTE